MIRPALDWEDAEHAAGVLAKGVEIVLNLLGFAAAREERREKREAEACSEHEGEEGRTLEQVLTDHEKRLRAVERRARRKGPK